MVKILSFQLIFTAAPVIIDLTIRCGGWGDRDSPGLSEGDGLFHFSISPANFLIPLRIASALSTNFCSQYNRSI